MGAAILGELEAVLVETCGWASDRAAAVRAELEAIAEVVTPVDIPAVSAGILTTIRSLRSRLLDRRMLLSPGTRTTGAWRAWRRQHQLHRRLRGAGEGLEKGGRLHTYYPHHVHAIPAKSRTRPLVVIPTISRRKQCKSNSTRVVDSHGY